jgi:hypothetical protein
MKIVKVIASGSSRTNSFVLDDPDFDGWNDYQQDAFAADIQHLKNGNMSPEYFRICLKAAFECGYHQARGAKYQR